MYKPRESPTMLLGLLSLSLIFLAVLTSGMLDAFKKSAGYGVIAGFLFAFICVLAVIIYYMYVLLKHKMKFSLKELLVVYGGLIVILASSAIHPAIAMCLIIIISVVSLFWSTLKKPL